MSEMPNDLLEKTEKGSVEESLVREIDHTRLPRHIAVIMDGNGRWAKAKRRPRVFGHRAGIASVRETVETCARLDIEVLTLYAFSTENWNRPRAEVRTLMSLLREYLRREIQTLQENDIRFRAIGRIHELPQIVQDELHEVEELTRANKGLTFQIALSYGGRGEIVDACRSLIDDALSNGKTAPDLSEDDIARHLYTAGQPDPDLLIRTSGELRISNFLLWQIAYAEIWITPTLWPDFRMRHLLEGIIEFQKRDRRYGGVHPVPGT